VFLKQGSSNSVYSPKEIRIYFGFLANIIFIVIAAR
jgi:hypothetical protein